jgi:cell wall-associated NlpC family hydrolase
MPDSTLYRPNPQHFRTGDLVWVKRDDQVIAFTDRNGAKHAKTRLDTAQADVDAGKRQALAHSIWTAAQRQHIAQWQPDPLHADIWVGHIGIIHMHLGQPWVIDATPDRHQPSLSGQTAALNPPGVAAQTYAAWLSDTGHTQSHVWHGRVKGLSDAQANATVDFARSHIGKPYRFLPWGFASGELFYCSELVWCAVREASGILLDDIASTMRVDWFTPWMAMKSQHIERLYEPPDRYYGL